MGTIVALIVLGSAGCSSTRDARYVYQDGESGVIAIPKNTSRWPNRYREQAARLMANHFPEGYQIVRSEEVIQGERTTKLDDAKGADFDPSLLHPLRLGKFNRSSASSTSDTLKLRECRIVYIRKAPGAASRAGNFALTASYSPLPYDDPNAVLARLNPEKFRTAAGSPGVQQAVFDGAGKKAP